MINWIRNILLVLLVTMTSSQAAAMYFITDTVYFYDSWEQILDNQPKAMMVGATLIPVSGSEVSISSGFNDTDVMIRKEYIAFSLSDSLWFINSNFIKTHYKGDVKGFRGFAPLYFNEKTAFAVSSAPLSVYDVLFGNDEEGYTSRIPDYYYFDFRNRRIDRVTPEYLSSLLEDYRDLLMRYEGMSNYKNPEIIEDFFFKYIDRVTDDIMRPNILDLVD